MWGAGHEGDPGVATFGPATGKVGDSDKEGHPKCLNHTCGSEYCIHNDNWTTIKENLAKNPHCYDKCIEEGCTKNIELKLNEVIATEEGEWFDFVNCSVLDGCIKTTFKRFNFWSADDQECGNWAKCRLRATLNGKNDMILSKYAYKEGETDDCLDISNCLFSCFPTELQKIILPKTYNIATSWSTSELDNYTIKEWDTVTDKLWIPSANEVYGISDDYKDTDESLLGASHYTTRLSSSNFAGKDGVTYTNYGYNIPGKDRNDGLFMTYWLRSPYRSDNDQVGVCDWDGSYTHYNSGGINRIALCFCI